MGSEVDLPSGCMFDWVCIHTVPYFERGEMFHIGRLNMLSMQKKVEDTFTQCGIFNEAERFTSGD